MNQREFEYLRSQPREPGEGRGFPLQASEKTFRIWIEDWSIEEKERDAKTTFSKAEIKSLGLN